MPPAAWATLLISALIIAVTGLALLRVILMLQHVSFTLGTVIVGVRAIAHQTRAVPPAIESVNANLAPVRSAAEQV
ncbi:MAG: hypothetical protein GEU83_07325 [Pseudonocardiaceae bacterium]|nr:hypothetical protein [Pseudonocardiaceae bacterium]